MIFSLVGICVLIADKKIVDTKTLKLNSIFCTDYNFSTMKIRDILFYAGLTVVIILSFFLYSSRHHPLLNSDDALNILMTFYYKLPQDLYCWGQDRGGTLIPLIGQIFHKYFGISAVNAVSISNYFILILGYIGFSSLFKSKLTKLVFAIIWFFPPIRFIDLNRFPLGMQYSLIGFSVLFVNKIDFKNKKLVLNHILIIVVLLILSVSIWVSDLAIVTIVLLGITLFTFNSLRSNKLRLNKIILAYILLGTVGNYLFIRYAKSYATGAAKYYTSFNNLDTFFQSVNVLKAEVFKIFAFQNEEFLLSIYAWLVLIFTFFCISAIYKKSLILTADSKKWLIFFLLDFFTVFGVILVSKWVYLNGMGRWYFIPLYISFSMAILQVFDHLEPDYHKNLIAKSALVFIVLVGAFSSIHYLKYIRPKTLRSKIDVRSEFLELGEIGIIGEFWNSYISACPDPYRIKATAFDGAAVRNQRLVDEVFAQPKIYVIKDMWLKSFPDTLKQFSYVLVKKDSSFSLGDCIINRYEKIKRDEIIPFESLKFNEAVNRTAAGIELQIKNKELKDKYIIWGPYLPIGIGDFTIKYKLKIENIRDANPVAKFDIVAGYGKTVLAQKTLSAEKLDSSGYFELSFRTDKRYRDIEFRTYFYGNSDLIIKELQLVEK
ncbi:hypothetical protein GM418_24825 [Maribellus comscasis]|uniref:Glycosyltransferase RgtA/B/C/D-like domain-containing protein n=1 Tax=Maribellus comscasis TaxID=2681766 RepID=A0A6I6K562_9BACT|nr:hypothetical protein [Maribellus comscasis]QGY46763.1 hypothetical protein GM418_24825 [Maribellus comscasis]